MKKNIKAFYAETAVRIRPAKPEDLKEIAELYYKSYYTRFFDEKALGRDKKPYDAPLAKEFPVLKLGQNQQWFLDYCRKFIASTQDGDPKTRNYCFVAEVVQNGQFKIVGMVKGSAAAIDADVYKSVSKTLGTIQPKEDWGELGSIYIAPDVQTAGIGRQLMQRWARLMQDVGRKAMITRAYDGNDSPYFFAKLGAEKWTGCTITNAYYSYDPAGKPTEKTLDIPGVCMIWSEASFKALATYNDIANIPKGQTVTGGKMSDLSVPKPRVPVGRVKKIKMAGDKKRF